MKVHKAICVAGFLLVVLGIQAANRLDNLRGQPQASSLDSAYLISVKKAQQICYVGTVAVLTLVASCCVKFMRRAYDRQSY